FEHVSDVSQMVLHATEIAKRHQFADVNDTVVIIAGLPFGHSGSTNLLHVATITD
ncbi:MAG TPA: pyruvate kinase alpha/beta domain-containing protein, partial [Paenalcaligenes sp.]|nr:pyruvate kinase alpha/beta domain-containing protein [Paenalcaligenes sp.]